MNIEDCEDGGEIVVEEEEIVQDMSEGRCVGTSSTETSNVCQCLTSK